MARSAAIALALVVVACAPPQGERVVAVPSSTPSAVAPASASASRSSATSAAPSAVASATTPTPSPTAVPRTGALIDLREFPLASGELSGVTVQGGAAVIASGISGTWTSPWYEPPAPFARLIPSWTATTPDGTFIRIRMQARRAGGGESSFYSFGIWASGDASVQRASTDGQRDASGRIDTDTYIAAAPMIAYRLRVELFRPGPTDASPALRSIFAVASDPSTMITTYPSAPVEKAADLSVPSYSQEIHAGEYPQYDGGGEAWCSPTSTAMVLAFWGKGPTSADLAWVDKRYADPVVDHAARYTYDATYGGAGNWPFNTAYAATFGLRAFVTQLRSLAEAERFIASGIPLVASVKIAPGALPGFLFPQGTNGHLLVIRGFTSTGDVIANDPAARGNDTVRRVYPRAAFEKAWLGGSSGTVYVIHPPDRPLPDRIGGATPNW